MGVLKRSLNTSFRGCLQIPCTIHILQLLKLFVIALPNSTRSINTNRTHTQNQRIKWFLGGSCIQMDRPKKSFEEFHTQPPHSSDCTPAAHRPFCATCVCVARVWVLSVPPPAHTPRRRRSAGLGSGSGSGLRPKGTPWTLCAIPLAPTSRRLPSPRPSTVRPPPQPGLCVLSHWARALPPPWWRCPCHPSPRRRAVGSRRNPMARGVASCVTLRPPWSPCPPGEVEVGSGVRSAGFCFTPLRAALPHQLLPGNTNSIVLFCYYYPILFVLPPQISSF